MVVQRNTTPRRSRRTRHLREFRKRAMLGHWARHHGPVCAPSSVDDQRAAHVAHFTGSVEKVQRLVTAQTRATNIALLIDRLLATSTSRDFIVSTFGSSGTTNVPCNPWS